MDNEQINNLKKNVIELVTMARYGLPADDLVKNLKGKYSVDLVADILSTLEGDGTIIVESEEFDGISADRYFIKR
jgi:hypothetical protein